MEYTSKRRFRNMINAIIKKSGKVAYVLIKRYVPAPI